jgi:uncharacterized membrane protein YfcA
MDRACGPARSLRDRRDRYPGRDLRRGPAAALPGQRARHAQPGRHAHEPALQRYCHPRGSIPVQAAAPGRRPPGLLLTGGTLPGVIAGSVIRVELIPGPKIFDLVVSAVLLPLGAWLTATRPARQEDPVRPSRHIPSPVLIALACMVGCIGGIYGIGGGSILAPVLIGAGRPAADVAPAALASTFVTSVAGVVTFTILSVHHPGSVAPDWPTGIALGLGGLAGAYTGARIQARLPDTLIRRIVGILVIAIAARYLWSGLS